MKLKFIFNKSYDLEMVYGYLKKSEKIWLTGKKWMLIWN